MTTKQIGNIGESRVLFEFVKRGIPVYLPFGDNESADIIADFNGKLNKIQVKTTTFEKTPGSIEFNIAKRPTGEGKRIAYNDNQVDYFALYAVNLDEVFLVPFSRITSKSTFTIRYKNFLPGSNCGEDFLFDKIIQ